MQITMITSSAIASGRTLVSSVRPKVANRLAAMNEPIMNTSPWAKLISSTMP